MAKNTRHPRFKSGNGPKLTGGSPQQFDRYLHQPKNNKQIFNASKKRQQRRYLGFIFMAFALIAIIIIGIKLAYQ